MEDEKFRVSDVLPADGDYHAKMKVKERGFRCQFLA